MSRYFSNLTCSALWNIFVDSWVMLRDKQIEQLIHYCPLFSIRNDTQLSNLVGVEHDRWKLSPTTVKVENVCIWKVTTIGWAHFKCPWLLEEGVMASQGLCLQMASQTTTLRVSTWGKNTSSFTIIHHDISYVFNLQAYVYLQCIICIYIYVICIDIM